METPSAYWAILGANVAAAGLIAGIALTGRTHTERFNKTKDGKVMPASGRAPTVEEEEREEKHGGGKGNKKKKKKR